MNSVIIRDDLVTSVCLLLSIRARAFLPNKQIIV